MRLSCVQSQMHFPRQPQAGWNPIRNRNPSGSVSWRAYISQGREERGIRSARGVEIKMQRIWCYLVTIKRIKKTSFSNLEFSRKSILHVLVLFFIFIRFCENLMKNGIDTQHRMNEWIPTRSPIRLHTNSTTASTSSAAESQNSERNKRLISIQFINVWLSLTF